MELAQKTGGGARGLIATRRGTIAVALVCAAIAVGVLVYAAHQYKQSVNNQNRPETVLVATSVIQKGTAAAAISSQGMFKAQTIVAKQVTRGAVADVSTLLGKAAATNIYPGQQLTLADFAPSIGVASALAANERAVSVPIGAANGLAGNLVGGDHVDIYIGVNGVSGGRAQAEFRLLAANILVLVAPGAGGGGGLGSSNNGGGGGNVTLALPNDLVPTLMFAAGNGTLWFALRPGNAANPNPRTIATIQTILLGGGAIATTGGH